ncbi:DUF4870 domain-containing protein [Flavobacterium psychrophilum]|uniref:DUF4870 domain-containing protein n=1 Tax=Flavobacterium psychrophilum TaxID=96345 RepID=UPI001C8F54F2|nr:DUF4870 domain-containing protein [Flavobacterium psychrophilum]EKT4519756.1 DUF4870 domain-containing protein [Flavobacterium psychrophilum]EKT4552487.1 DUF4870 domain-containing protein [Flavobacterium psychrophilum]QZL00919.1 DUF4870 domain-containing protein [Flavobacterium psychrophilum]
MEAVLVSAKEKNYGTFIHLSVLTKYFIPFGNYVLPIVLWASRKDSSKFTDYNGKQVINFQLSMLLYSVILLVVSIPILLFSIFNTVSFNDFDKGNFIFEKLCAGNVSGIVIVALVAIGLFCFMKIAEFFLIIYGAIKTNEGEYFKYPLVINFFK